jgi:hypothetical protein
MAPLFYKVETMLELSCVSSQFLAVPLSQALFQSWKAAGRRHGKAALHHALFCARHQRKCVMRGRVTRVEGGGGDDTAVCCLVI